MKKLAKILLGCLACGCVIVSGTLGAVVLSQSVGVGMIVGGILFYFSYNIMDIVVGEP